MAVIASKNGAVFSADTSQREGSRFNPQIGGEIYLFF